MTNPSVSDHTALYRICVQGRLDRTWFEYFEPLAIRFETGDQGEVFTILEGSIIDQAALHGILHNLYQLGFPLISIEKKGEVVK